MRVVQQVASSCIEQIAYDTYKHILVVTINATDYVYYDIGFLQYKAFMQADSKGQFFSRYVRGRW